jgi:hypothetical protein
LFVIVAPDGTVIVVPLAPKVIFFGIEIVEALLSPQLYLSQVYSL